ncbi:MAG: hypothetical protein M1838_000276 [Thelocarpon superellum]|nr:MAG: hypothetical protein M1838_000276 [Thelocarpon superellum]
MNSTILIELNYVNTNGGGLQAWESPKTENNYGFISVTMDDNWRQGNSMNNLTFTMVELDPTADARAKTIGGPTVALIQKPPTYPQPSPPTQAPNKLGLMVGLPVTLGSLVMIMLCLYVSTRKTRRIGLGNVMGRRRGYGVGKSRRQRLRTGRVRGGAIRLSDDEEDGGIPSHGRSTGDGDFRDEPNRGVELSRRRGATSTPTNHQHGRSDSLGLGSLVGSPGGTEGEDGELGDDERERRGSATASGPGTGRAPSNVFRDEIDRQQWLRSGSGGLGH